MGHVDRALAQARERQKSTIAPRKAFPEAADSGGLTFDSLQRVVLDPTHLERHRVVASSGRTVPGESFKMLRTRVKRAMQTQNLTTLAVSSAAPSDGKTLVSVNLAFTMAAQVGIEVVLVDFDLRHPSVSRILGLDPALPGLDAYFSDAAKLQDLFICPEHEQLAILPNTDVFDNSSELLSSMRSAQLVSELRSSTSTRIVIFDMPPLLSADDFLAFSPHIDALLLVACEGKTKRTELTEAIERLGDINIIGTVLNRSLGRSETYYY